MMCSNEKFEALLKRLYVKLGLATEVSYDEMRKQTPKPELARRLAVELFIREDDNKLIREYLLELHKYGNVMFTE